MVGLVTEIQNLEEFIAAIRSSDERIVVMDFAAVWCPPCKAIAPFYAELAAKYECLAFFKVNVDVPGLDEAARIYEINSLPTFCIFHQSRNIDRLTGGHRVLLEELVSKYAHPLDITAAPIENVPADVV